MKQNNNGFSLVELIIVIAIMAILVAVLAPQYLRYVDKARYSKDIQTIEAVYSAIATTFANPEFGEHVGEDVYVVFDLPPYEGDADEAHIHAGSMDPEAKKIVDEVLATDDFTKGVKLSCSSYKASDNVPKGIAEDAHSGSKDQPVIIVRSNGSVEKYIPDYGRP